MSSRVTVACIFLVVMCGVVLCCVVLRVVLYLICEAKGVGPRTKQAPGHVEHRHVQGTYQRKSRLLQHAVLHAHLSVLLYHHSLTAPPPPTLTPQPAGPQITLSQAQRPQCHTAPRQSAPHPRAVTGWRRKNFAVQKSPRAAKECDAHLYKHTHTYTHTRACIYGDAHLILGVGGKRSRRRRRDRTSGPYMHVLLVYYI